MKLKRNDNVKVIAGKNVGDTGRVLHVDHEKNMAIVEGINMITKNQKPSRTNQRGGTIRKEAPIHVSNLMYLHHNKPTRIGYRVEIAERDDGGRQVIRERVARSTGEVIE